MKPIRVDVALLVAHTGASSLIPEDRCRLFDAIPTALLLGVAGWATEGDWCRALGFSQDGWKVFGRRVFAPILEHPEGWGIRPLAEAVEGQKAVSLKRAKAGRKGGLRKQKKANAKQTEANAKQMLALASTASAATDSEGGFSGAGVVSPSSIESLDSRDSAVELFLWGVQGGKWVPTAEQVAAWREAYPAVGLAAEFAKMRGWLASNPGRAKSDRGLPRFVNSWLSRSTPTVAVPDSGEDRGSVWGLTPKREVARG
jgi:hypothetical protein